MFEIDVVPVSFVVELGSVLRSVELELAFELFTFVDVETGEVVPFNVVTGSIVEVADIV